MFIQMIVIAGLAIVGALAAAYLLGEARGSRTAYEPVPTDLSYTPTPDFEAEEHLVSRLEESVVVDLLPQLTAEELEQLDARLADISDEVQHVETLASRYRREALIAKKRLDAAIRMLHAPRRPSAKAIAEAVVEVQGREVPVLPRGGE
jgi:hypothetical protein